MAGETIFTVLEGDPLVACVKQALCGARRMSEVTNISQLAELILPPFDEARAEEVEATYGGSSFSRANDRYEPYDYRRPERTINLCSSTYTVSQKWRGDGLCVRIYASPETDLSLLPDAGVYWEGQVVEVEVIVDYSETFSGTNIVDLKRRLREKYIAHCVERYLGRSDYGRVECNGNAVVEHPVCRDPVTGQPVYTYGTMRLSSGGTFVSAWFKTREEADRQLASVQAVLDARKGKGEKKDGLKEQASQINRLLAWITTQCQDEEIPAPAGVQLPLMEVLQIQQKQFQDLNFNRISQVDKWIETANNLVTRGLNTILRQSLILKKAIENLFELTLTIIPENEQAEQIERLDTLEKLIEKTAPSGSAEILSAAAMVVLTAQ